ncbi:hypothetical protein EV360DRAFT_75844 [Lentinula raphanica]|nr:hypothetical protein EV360DRAFT_75844 [Lentinula raphanica]
MVHSHTVLTAVLAVGAASTIRAAPLSAAPNPMRPVGSTGVQGSAYLKRAPLPGSGSGLGLSSRELDARDLKIIFGEESQEYMERKAKDKGLDLDRMYNELGYNGGSVKPSTPQKPRTETPEYRTEAVLNTYPGWPKQVQRCGGDLTKTNVYQALEAKEKIDEPLFKAGVKILEDEWKACQKSSTKGTAPVSTPTAPRRRGSGLDFHFDRRDEGNPSGVQFPSGRSTLAAPSSPMGASSDTMDSSPLNAMGALPNAAASHSSPSSLLSDHSPTLPLRDSVAGVSALPATPETDVFHLHRYGSPTDFGHPDTVVDIEPTSPSAYAYDSYGDDLD